MEVKILKEAGHCASITGLSLSYDVSFDHANKVSHVLADKDGGHNKFLESIYVWLDVTAPRFWWQEADTYRLSTKQSASTMHTIHRRNLKQEDFDEPIFPAYLDELNAKVAKYNKSKSIPDLVSLKNALPEGFMQRRIWVVNYKTLRNILLQRTTHRLPHWKLFCAAIRVQALAPHLLPADSNATMRQ